MILGHKISVLRRPRKRRKDAKAAVSISTALKRQVGVIEGKRISPGGMGEHHWSLEGRVTSDEHFTLDH